MLVRGIVQGVGFRPFVYNLATALGLGGYVKNAGDGVRIEVEGSPEALEEFLKKLTGSPPRLARVARVETREVVPLGEVTFRIDASDGRAAREALVPADVALCDLCKAEMADPRNRRWRYPFTNCTACGPRYTIIYDIPYDRPYTSMNGFQMCRECAEEYHDPGDRRFHAQPNACGACGPRAWWWASPGGAGREKRSVSGFPGGDPVDTRQTGCREGQGAAALAEFDGISETGWAEEAVRVIRGGGVVAIKGLGGFHIACDASSEEAVSELRRRKRRPFKPLAVMCRDLEAARKYCEIDDEEERILSSPEAPVVILRRKPGCGLARSLAPNLETLGVMLPYTPLHICLFWTPGAPDCLVMTSGNTSDLPIVKDNDEAVAVLGRIADGFVFHNRKIVNRCDDSVGMVVEGEFRCHRRARGFVPGPLKVPVPASSASPGQSRGETGFADQREDAPALVLGLGAEMKNTFCLLKGDLAFLGPHIGEMSYAETMSHYREALERYVRLFGAEGLWEEGIVAYDPHPGYLVSRLADEFPEGRRVAVQHHHAHFASCLAENGVSRFPHPAIGLVCDGTGYGWDGNVWGCEILAGDYADAARLGHLEYAAMPGAERAVREPWRMAVAYLLAAYGEDVGLSKAAALFPDRGCGVELCAAMARRCLNAPHTSSLGRLFDGVAALLGVCLENTYDGQAAMELTDLAAPELRRKGGLDDRYPLEVRVRDGQFVLSWHPIVRGTVEDLEGGEDRARIAARFHRSIVALLVEGVASAAEAVGASQVALSGGCFQNPYLLRESMRQLAVRGFDVLTQSRVPSGDGGVALGQACVAKWRWWKGVSGGSGPGPLRTG